MIDQQYILEATHIAKRFSNVIALRDASLRLMPGEVHGLLGANGAGKSTFVKILTGAIEFGSGELLLEGKAYEAKSPAHAMRKGLVSIYQEPSLVPHLTIRENVKLSGVQADLVQSRLQKFGLQDVEWDAKARDFSLPLRRMIDVARSLAANPKVVFFDEATAALSVEFAEMIFNEVKELKSHGIAVVYISHRLGEIERLCDRSTVLRDGVVADVVEAAEKSSHRIVSLMLGEAQHSDVKARSNTRISGKTVLSVSGLSAGYQLKNVRFEIKRGEVLGLAALEGQGQEQLFECLAGLRQPESGEIVVSGEKRSFSHPVDAINAGIALVPAERQRVLLPNRSVEENIWLPKLRSIRSWGPIPRSIRRQQVSKVVQGLSIDMRAASQVSQLSGGNQQKVVIARWLCNGFDLLLCFDPTRGVDVGAKKQVFDLVRDVADQGAGVLYFTSDLTEIEQVSDRSIVLFGGEIVAEFPLDDCSEANLLQAAHGLTTEEQPRLQS